MTAQNEEKMREAFETLASSNGLSTQMREDSASPDTYFAYETEQRWIVWQAAIAEGEQERKQLEDRIEAYENIAKLADAAIQQKTEQLSESQKSEAELRERVKELEAQLSRRELYFANELSAAKQEGYEQGYAKGSAVAVEAEMIAEQRGRDEVLRELSEQEPVASICTVKFGDKVAERFIRFGTLVSDGEHETIDMLIIRPSAPIAATNGERHE